MGIECGRVREAYFNTEQPIYETLCSSIENELIFHNINIMDLVHKIKEVEGNKRYFFAEDVLKVFELYGVSEKEFLAPTSVYKEIMPELTVCNTCKQYLLLTALPFCKGAIGEKKEVLWRLLGPDNKGLSVELLKNAINMIANTSIRKIAEITINKYSDINEIKEDTEFIQLLQNNCIEEYTDYCYLKELEDEQYINRYEYDLWMLKISADKMLNSIGNRERFLLFTKLCKQ